MGEALSPDAPTPKTHSSPDTLARKLTVIRRDDFNPDREEYHLGMVAIPVPVTNTEGRFYTALAIHGLSQRFSLESARDSFDGLSDAVAQIKTILFANDLPVLAG